MSKDKKEVLRKGIGDLEKVKQDKIGEFKELLTSLETLQDKKKMLWMHIYENAVDDRMHAYILFTDLFIETKSKAAEHQLNGPILAKYVERMSRANDQLIKLAELVQKAQDEEEKGADADSIFAQIQEG